MIITINFSSKQLEEVDKKYVFEGEHSRFPLKEGERFLYKDMIFVITEYLYDLSTHGFTVAAKDYHEYLGLGGRA